MKVFIQSSPNCFPHNYNFFNAYEGFLDMGAEIVHFSTPQELSLSTREDIVVGYQCRFWLMVVLNPCFVDV